VWRTIQYAQVDGGELRAAEQPRHTAELRDAVRTRRFPSCSTTPPRTESASVRASSTAWRRSARG